MLIRKLVHHLIILNSLKLLIGLVGTCNANVYHSLQIDIERHAVVIQIKGFEQC